MNHIKWFYHHSTYDRLMDKIIMLRMALVCQPMQRGMSQNSTTYHGVNMITTVHISEFEPSRDKIIWDVRDADKYQQGHIEHAINHPLGSLNKALLDASEGDIYVLCGGGTKAQKAVALLNELDPTRHIIHLTGGTRAASDIGMTIVREGETQEEDI